MLLQKKKEEEEEDVDKGGAASFFFSSRFFFSITSPFRCFASDSVTISSPSCQYGIPHSNIGRVPNKMHHRVRDISKHVYPHPKVSLHHIMDKSQYTAIVLGGTISIIAASAMIADAVHIYRTSTRTTGTAYVVYTAAGVISWMALTGLVAGGSAAPMPMFGILYALTAFLWIILEKAPRHIAWGIFLASFSLYWNVSGGGDHTIITAATPALIVHAGIALLLVRPRT